MGELISRGENAELIVCGDTFTSCDGRSEEVVLGAMARERLMLELASEEEMVDGASIELADEENVG